MSLDVYLEAETPQRTESSSRIYIRDGGQNREITHAEWSEMYPGREPLVVEYEEESTTVYTDNITHNLGNMAGEANLYEYLWRPDENEIEWAYQLIEPLQKGLERLERAPDFFQQFNPDNGWGTYESLVRFTRRYLEACKQHPETRVRVSW